MDLCPDGRVFTLFCREDTLKIWLQNTPSKKNMPRVMQYDAIVTMWVQKGQIRQMSHFF